MQDGAGSRASAAEQVKENIPVFGKDFPLPCTRNGVYSTDINTDWTPGFYTGMCWLAYEATGEEVFRTAALQQVDSFAARLVCNENLDHHDLGFLYTPSCVAGYQLTGSTAARNAALEAAARLTKRYQPIGQFLQAWLDRVPHTPKSERTTWRALEAGLRPENWLRAVELFGDALGDQS